MRFWLGSEVQDYKVCFLFLMSGSFRASFLYPTFACFACIACSDELEPILYVMAVMAGVVAGSQRGDGGFVFMCFFLRGDDTLRCEPVRLGRLPPAFVPLCEEPFFAVLFWGTVSPSPPPDALACSLAPSLHHFTHHNVSSSTDTR